MQFRRKRPDRGRAPSGLSFARSPAFLSLASVAALVLAASLLRDNGYNGYYQPFEPTETTAVADAETRPAVRPPPLRVGQRKAAAATRAKADLPLPCPAVRLPASSAGPLDGTKIAILTGWEVPSGWSDREAFASSFGRHGQYVKGNDVQPFRDAKTGEKCATSTDGLVKAMSVLSANSKSGDGDNGRRGKEILFFTNDVENPPFLADLSSRHVVPPAVSSLPPFSNSSASFRVFSAMERGSSHPLHSHGAAWLGQASGSRLWYLLPPGTPRSEWGPRVNACEYAREGSGVEPPEGAVSCVQRAGEVVYLPGGWVHATCALEGWSVGVGGQEGSPAAYDQDFEALGPAGEEEHGRGGRAAVEMSKLVDCGVFDEGDAADYLDLIRHAKDGATPGPLRDQGKADVGIADAAKNQPKDSDAKDAGSDWRWFDGDLNEYYNSLERDEHGKRDPNVITSYAVHRWLGPEASTLIHYELVRGEIYWRLLGRTLGDEGEGSRVGLRVFDAGCGLGPGLMYLEQKEPSWDLVGHTISSEQHRWITEDLPPHRFAARLRSYDEPLADGDGEDGRYHAIYSIEAAIHSPDLRHTLARWSSALEPGGIVVLIDDFLSVGVDRDSDPDVELFVKSWLANSVVTTTELSEWSDGIGLALVNDRDLGSEYQVLKRNYRGMRPEVKVQRGLKHQGWLGSKIRAKLMFDGKITYRMVVLRKKGDPPALLPGGAALTSTGQSSSCDPAPPLSHPEGPRLDVTIDPVLMSGRGRRGGKAMACISSWYCCDKGVEIWDDLEKTRTERTGFLQLPRELFGHYLESFARHLTDFYRTYPADYPGAGGAQKGIFLDIGGTGSTASGMAQVTSKFANFAGPLDYWVLDSDEKARSVTNAIVCDVDDCPQAPDCGYDVTFSHTVLEHASRPWRSFETISRITRPGGLTLHLVPWSYQHHATPEDNYRFSHTALRVLLEDGGFEVLDVGYDVCTKPEQMLKTKKDEHFDTIWLTYIVGRKLQ